MTAMTFLFGAVLLAVGLILAFVARERADGTSLLRLGGGMDMIYPAVCLAFIALGCAFMITNW